MVWGNGVRAGMYPLSEHEAYWFTCFNADANVSHKRPAAMVLDILQALLRRPVSCTC